MPRILWEHKGAFILDLAESSQGKIFGVGDI